MARPGAWFNTEKTPHLQRQFGFNKVHWALFFLITVGAIVNLALHNEANTLLLPTILIWFLLKETYGLFWGDDRLRRNHLKTIEGATGTFSAPVEIDIVQDGILTGSDIGHAWIQDASLHYSGEQTSFVLGGQHIEHLKKVARKNWLWDLPQPTLSVHLIHDRRSIELRIICKEPSNPYSRKWDAFENWSLSSPQSDTLQQFVPLAMNPNLRLDARSSALYRSSFGFIFILLLIPYLHQYALCFLPLVLLIDYKLLHDYRRFRTLMVELESETRGLNAKT